MKSYIRFLSRNKLYTAIEVAGLSIALAFVVFIATFVAGEFGYDSALKNTDDIYLAHAESFPIMSYTVGDVLKESYPEVEEVCRFISTNVLAGLAMEVTVGEETVPQKAIIADTNFFRFFTFPFVEGSAEDALAERDAVVVSESFANIHFPDSSPVGQRIMVTIRNDKRDLTITGVFKDFKRSVFPETEIIYGIQHVKDFYPNLVREGNGTAVNFFRLAPGTDIAGLQEKAFEKLQQADILYNCGLFKKFLLSPFRQIHYGVTEQHVPFVGIINLNFVLLFAAAGILLLVFAVLNYISLTVAQIGFRVREMATRRLLGEQKWEIVLRYFKEALLLTVLSFAIALLLIETMGPYAKVLLGKEVNLMENLTPGLIVALVASVFAVSFLAGAVPAVLVSRYQPIDVVKGVFGGSSRMALGKVFLWVQNVVAIATLCVAFAMTLQLKHLLSRDSGYQRDNIVEVSGAQRGSQYLVDELLQLPFVEAVGRVQAAPANNNVSGMGLTYKGEHVQMEMSYCDSAAFRILGFAVLSTNPSVGQRDNTFWLTEGAMKTLGLDYNSETVVFDGREPVGISGVIKDFQKGNRSMEDCASSNMVWQNMEYTENNFSWLRNIIIKVVGDEDEAVAKLKEFYAQHAPDSRIFVVSQNETYRGFYTVEENNLKLIGIFTFLVIMLSAMAMLAMSTYYAKNEARNWSVRKVFGCSRSQVFANMVMGFLKVIAVAAVMAVPLGWFIVDGWLAGYSYRIGNQWWLYATALLTVAFIAIVSISWQAVRLMNSNPIKELKQS